MASQFAILAIFAFVALPSVALAMQWTVGDDSGWTNGYNYTDWAKDKVFQVGDSLLFNYQAPHHNVFKVNMTDFQACNIPPANEALTTGHDVIPLSTPGVKWYICGIGEHCAKSNQKLKITVVADTQVPASPPAVVEPGTSGTNALVSASFKFLAAAGVALVLVTV
ncbi:blue copper protein 1a-like [Rhodamnia argentea]|uniref:Blue copper protein 1a-like n=1 Tax=Rhodamnia argentea TaxID=178133 RepID=A0A8B8NDL6_9MYRT|nr:blue copper protein 1a-like [Rhodamnia argentea]